MSRGQLKSPGEIKELYQKTIELMETDPDRTKVGSYALVAATLGWVLGQDEDEIEGLIDSASEAYDHPANGALAAAIVV